jgi:hemolysin D
MASTPKSNPQTTVEFPTLPASPHHWSAAVQTVLDQPPPTLPSRLALGATLFCLVFAAWSWFGQIDDVAKASGKLIPKDEVYKIHPLDLGKVVRIAVKEGETVTAGQVLVELDTDIAAKDVERLEKQLSATRTELTQVEELLSKTRLQAQAQTVIAQTAIQAQQVAIAQGRITTSNSQSLAAQLHEDETEQTKRLKRLQALSDAGAFPKERSFEAEQMLRDRRRTITENQSTLDKTLQELQRLQVGLDEKMTEAEQVRLEGQQKSQELEIKLTELRSKVNETKVTLEAAKAKLKQRYLYAPVDGVILTLNVRQSGEVVQSGQAIAEVAPSGKPLILATALPSHDAGFIKVGMTVRIKLDAYPFQEYGIISGKVMTISHDSKPDERLGQVYRVEIELAQDHINAKGQSIAFKAGQTASAEIITHRRRIADVLLDPLKKLQSGTTL